MKKISLSDLFERRRKTRVLTLLALIVIAGFFIRVIILDKPQLTKANNIDIIGNSATIRSTFNNGIYYIIDPDGYVYRFGDVSEGIGSINVRHSSYMAPLLDPNYCSGMNPCRISSNMDLTIDGAYVIMEGTQDFNSLSLVNGATISQPYADRDGDINTPIYTADYWGARFTGYMNVPPHNPNGTTLCLYSNKINGGIFIEVGENQDGTASTSLEPHHWQPVYRIAGGEYGNEWGAAVNSNNPCSNQFNDPAIHSALSNDSNTDKYVPVRFSFSDVFADTYWQLNINHLNYSGGPGVRGVGYEPPRNLRTYELWSGLIDNLPASPQGQSEMYFEYFVSANIPELKLDSTFDPSTARRTWPPLSTYNQKLNKINIETAFDNKFGDYNDTTGSPTDFDFEFYDREMSGTVPNRSSNPLGVDISQDYSGSDIRDFRYMVSRYTQFPYNTRLVDDLPFNTPAGNSRRVDGGLTLNIAQTISIDLNSQINLDGTGYPGWANEFVDMDNGFGTQDWNAAPYNNQIGGGPGGGQSNANGGGGYSHAGGGNHAKRGGEASASPSSERSSPYGDVGLDFLTMGSGGGSAGDNAGDPNVGGAGGGALKIVANRILFDRSYAITANGVNGFQIQSNSGAAGAGGEVIIKVKQLDFGPNVSTHVVAVNGGGHGAEFTGDFSGGSGGYITVIYETSSNQSGVLLESLSSSTEEYGHFFLASGGEGGGNDAAKHNGDDGIISVVKTDSINNSGVTIKKTLTPLDRPGAGVNFNPYALQNGDKIQVNLDISNLAVNREITISDEKLKDPSSAAICQPNGQYPQEPNGATRDDSHIDDPNSPRIIWRFTPTTPQATIRYECKVIAP